MLQVVGWHPIISSSRMAISRKPLIANNNRQWRRYCLAFHMYVPSIFEGDSDMDGGRRETAGDIKKTMVGRH